MQVTNNGTVDLKLFNNGFFICRNLKYVFMDFN